MPTLVRAACLTHDADVARQLVDAGLEAFGPRMAQSRQLSNLSPVGMLVRDQRTLCGSIQVLMRYQAAMNGALAMLIEQQGELALIREELIALRTEPLRQAIELAVAVLFMMMRQQLGAGWQARLADRYQ